MPELTASQLGHVIVGAATVLGPSHDGDVVIRTNASGRRGSLSLVVEDIPRAVLDVVETELFRLGFYICDAETSRTIMRRAPLRLVG